MLLVSFLCPLKISENQHFFQGVQIETSNNKWVKVAMRKNICSMSTKNTPNTTSLVTVLVSLLSHIRRNCLFRKLYVHYIGHLRTILIQVKQSFLFFRYKFSEKILTYFIKLVFSFCVVLFTYCVKYEFVKRKRQNSMR